MTLIDEIQMEFPALLLRDHEPMAKHTSFHIGGLADIAFPQSAQELVSLYCYCLSKGVTPLILGAGTNILAPDEGLQTLVICTKQLGEIKLLDDQTVEAQCGVSMARLACFARDHSLTGLEFAHGIPGTVGGGVYMNAGAYGGEMQQVVVWTQCLLPDGTVWEAEGEQHGFSYRHSVFEDQHALILSTRLRLKSGDRETISKIMQELSKKRRLSQPLELPSAGSTFKRPVGGYAAALIDRAGLKGKGIGGAAVSEKHAGFVVNLGGATAADVRATVAYIQQEVENNFGIVLEPEIRIW